MAESCENLEDSLPDWVNEDVEKRLAEAVDKLQKQEEGKKHVSLKKNDLNSSSTSFSRAPLNETQTVSFLLYKNVSDTLGYRLVCHLFVLTTF